MPSHVSAAATVPSSTAASVHDSADDESELSELQEEDESELRDEVVVKPMFPHLSKRDEAASTDAGSGAQTPAADENKSDGDGDQKMTDANEAS